MNFINRLNSYPENYKHSPGYDSFLFPADGEKLFSYFFKTGG